MSEYLYNQDGLSTTHNTGWMSDPRFATAYAAGEATGSWSGAAIHWRVHVACWFAERAMQREGDLIECGVNRGGIARSILSYCSEQISAKRFYLLDTYEGIPNSVLSERERAHFGLFKDYYSECYQAVVQTFKAFPNVYPIRGLVPETFNQVESKQFCFVHIDMNNVKSEMAAAEYLWPLMVDGGVMLLDDYGWEACRDQRDAFDAFAAKRGLSVLSLPTGQGVLMKSEAKSNNISVPHNGLTIHPTAYVSENAVIQPSIKGSLFTIGAHTQIYDFVVIKAVGGSGDIKIGEHCYINPHCTLFSGNGITLGNYVLIAPGCTIAPTNHAFLSRQEVMRHQGFMPSKGGVVIEDDVWIGANSTILDGAHIGQGAVIAAGSVVRGEVGSFEIWGGVPARLIGQRPKDVELDVKLTDQEKKKPLVTVLIPTFNRAEMVKAAVGSVLTQTFADWQLIVSDNASTDHTREVMAELIAQDSRIQYFRHDENIGMLGNWESLIKRIDTKYFVVLTDDDLLLPRFFATILPHLENDPELGMCFGTTAILDADGRHLGNAPAAIKPGRYSVGEGAVEMTYRQHPASNGALTRTAAFLGVGGFDVRAQYVADLDFMVRVAACCPVMYVDHYVACHIQHANNAFANATAWYPGLTVLLENLQSMKGLSRQHLEGITNNLLAQAGRR
ncbi:glycosyltransferase [Paraburkholderia sp. SIMBA_049]